jgi:hypothetical protein
MGGILRLHPQLLGVGHPFGEQQLKIIKKTPQIARETHNYFET